MTHYSGFGEVLPCSRLVDDSAAPWDGDLETQNWSGMVAPSTNVVNAYGHTAFVASSACLGGNSSFTNWVGIGGWSGDPDLIQNGFWTDQNGAYGFYEAINSSHNTGVRTVSFTAGGVVENLVGDNFAIDTVAISTHTSDEFAWHDLDNGQVFDIVKSSYTIGGSTYPASSFYSGLSGEAIDERGLIGHYYTTMRNFVTDSWDGVTVQLYGGSPTPIRSFVTHEGLYIGSASNPAYAYVTGGSTNSMFHDTWVTCGAATYVP